jgi:crotonobetaine/carnitine-CoA ligase
MEKPTVPRVLGKLIEDRARRNGERIFLRFKDESVSYAQIDKFSNRCANGFMKLGITKGDKVSIMLPNCPEFLYAWFGLSKIGGVEVPVNTFYKGEFLRHIIDQSDSKIVVIFGEYLKRLESIQDQLGKVEKVIVVGNIQKEDAGKYRWPLMTFEGLFDNPEDPANVEVGPLDIMSIIYTSGTTGPAKGAVSTFNFKVLNAEVMLKYRPIRRDDVYLNFFPLYHDNAQCLVTISTLVAEAQMVLLERFSASLFWDQVHQSGATLFNSLGAVIPILMKQPEKETDADNPVSVVLSAACPPAMLPAAEKRFGIKIMEGFGMTETGMVCHHTLDDRKPGTCGKALDSFDVRLMDDDGNEVPLGEPGEICVRPRYHSSMFQEYYKMPEKTLEAFADLWYHTGDLAKKDAEGYFYFVDRKKDAFRRRGENISSFEVERVVLSHPSVLEAAAVAVPAELGEDEVKICVALRPMATLAPEELIAYCSERMPYFAVPRFVEFKGSLPKTPTERVEKYKLRQEGVTAHTWDREKAGIKLEK